MSYLSDGPFNYNRFNAMDQAYKDLYEKKSKPDFLDMDKDGNKKESMKKAIKDKEVNEWIESQVQEGHDLSEYTYDQVKDIFTEGGMPPWLKGKEEGGDDDKKDDKKSDKKEGKKKDKCDCKEEVLEYLVQEGFASNEVSAEVLYIHMSEGWRDHLEDVSEGYKSLPTSKMARQSGRAFDKEQDAVKAGDESGANKQMQRRIAMMNPQGRKAQLKK